MKATILPLAILLTKAHIIFDGRTQCSFVISNAMHWYRKVFIML